MLTVVVRAGKDTLKAHLDPQEKLLKVSLPVRLYQEHQTTSAAQYFPHSEAGWRQCGAVRPLTGSLVRLKGELKVVE